MDETGRGQWIGRVGAVHADVGQGQDELAAVPILVDAEIRELGGCRVAVHGGGECPDRVSDESPRLLVDFGQHQGMARQVPLWVLGRDVPDPVEDAGARMTDQPRPGGGAGLS